MLALVTPAIAAADTTAQVNITTTDTIAPTDTITSVATPGFDPLGTLAVVVGIRKDTTADKADNANLSNGIGDTSKENNRNWWDSFNFFSILIGNQTPVRHGPALNLTNQTLSKDLRPQSQNDRPDQKDAGNVTIYRIDTPMNRSEIQSDQVNLSITRQDTRDLRNVTPQNLTNISEQQLSDVRISRTNNASVTAVSRDTIKIRTDRQQISIEIGNQSSSS